MIRFIVLSTVCLSLLAAPAGAQAYEGVVSGDGGSGDVEYTYQPSDDVYTPEYYQNRVTRETESRAAVKQEAETNALTAQQRRAAEMAADQAAVKARAEAAANQPSDYATRLQGVKAAAPTTDPATVPGADEEQPVTETGGTPGTGTGTGTEIPGTGSGTDDNRSLLDQMMDAVQ